MQGRHAARIVWKPGFLRSLSINGDSIAGALPYSFSNLVNLQSFNVHSYGQNGTLDALATLPQLQSITVLNSGFRGSLPAITSPTFNSLSLTGAQITGAIPDYSGLPNMTVLNLQRLSGLTGALPRFPASLQTLIIDCGDFGPVCNLTGDLGASTTGVSVLCTRGTGLTNVPPNRGNCPWLTGPAPVTVWYPPPPLLQCTRSACAAGDDATQCAALYDLGLALGMCNYGWMNGRSYCTWSGVYCSGGGTNVLSLSLSRNSCYLGGCTYGAVSASFGDLIYLQMLDIMPYTLSGAFPSTVSRLVRLQQLTINNDGLTGEGLNYFGALPSLRSMSLTNCRGMTGGLPIITSLSLNTLSVFNSGFNGTIPDYSATNITTLTLYTMQGAMCGPLPPFIGGVLRGLRSL